MLGGAANEAWGQSYKVTYHILALPMDHSKGTANTTAAYDGWRTEAIKVEVASASTIQLEAHFKSPLAKNFTYYPESVVTKDATARQIYQYRNNNKYYLYKAPLAPYVKVTVSSGAITKEEVSNATAWEAAGEAKKTATSYADMETQAAALANGDYYFSFQAVALAEGDPIPSNNYHVYVTYEYDAANTIAKLDGSVDYNILIDGKFLAYNRGRNNRVALVPKENVSETQEKLISEDFVYVDVSNVNTLKDKTYWSSSDNPNPASETKSKFHFLFNYIGEDPYNITIRSAYDKDIYYIEKYGSEANFVKKWYKNSSLFAKTTDETIIASDENRKYTQTDYSNPSSEVTYDASDANKGYYHGILQKEIIWNSFAILNAVNGSGDIVSGKVVFMGTRTTKSDGNLNVPSSSNFYYLGSDNPATVKIKSYAKSGAPTVDKNMYEARTFNFIVKTPFGNTVSAPFKLSEYSIGKEIDVEDIPTSLKRKYCSYNGKFYKDAALTEQITKYSDLTEAPYNIYVGYTVDMPFNTIKPADSYSTATWYELTDAGSTEANGKKIKYDGSANFKNNGASGSYDKTTEFAFVGDPYELRVLYRDATETATANRYVGGSTNLGVSETAGDGYCWEIPSDNTNGSFLLRKFDGTGHWYWDASHLSESFSYSTKAHTFSVPNGNTQTLTLNISGLTYVNGHYIKVTAGGTDAAQVTSTTPTLSTGKGSVRIDGTATITVNLAANTSGSNKTFTLTIQEYNGSNDATIDAATVITVTQSASAYTGNVITYSTENSTRIKLLDLPTRNYTYNIVDKAGHIAAKATASQPIYSTLSLASIPSIIVSPLIVGETITFYDTFNNGTGAGTGTSRTHLSAQRYETPNTDAVIYVKYTTASLESKPAKLNETQQFNVKLNGLFLYYDTEDGVIKTNDDPDVSALKSSAYLWKLRNRDPYNMLIDNLGAREVLPDVEHKIAGQTETVTVYDDNGGTTTASRQQGAWVIIDGDLPTTSSGTALSFTTIRNNAQRFIAKSSTTLGVYEVMVATNTVDASTTYYNIGCPGENTVKIYDNTTYAHGSDILMFILNQNIDFTYHLIDKAKHELLTVESRNPELALPSMYQSPLVDTYNYYARDQISIDTSKNPDEYTPIDPAVKLTNINQLYAAYNDPVASNATAWENAESSFKLTATDDDDMIDKVRVLTETGDYIFNINNGESYKKITVTRGYRGNHIYVTYEKNNRVTFNDTGSPYMLKFLNPFDGGYYLEDGDDKLTKKKIQAVYPYCNGDGSLNIYGSAMNEEQMNGGSSTRPRWIWFFDSENNDPYHVKIHSKSTISYNSIAHPTYLQTYAVHFNQDADDDIQHIVTSGVLAGIASVYPTEYMVLGTEGHYKLLTTQPIAADLNGDGDTDDTVEGVKENERRYVTSFEQYWKTYNMIKQDLLGIDVKKDATYKDKTSNNESDWVVPTALRETLKTKLTSLQYTATSDGDLTTKINALTSTGVYYFRIGTSTYTYKKVTVTNIPASTLDSDYTIEECDAEDWEGLNYVDGWFWHSYDIIANAVRWNGYNDQGKSNTKLVEKIEHWFQTFDVGDGTFDIESADIPPVLVLLDRHGWEIMRKPLGYNSSAALDVLRTYDSPMVKEYKFYSNATKATGCHKYTLRMQNGAERDQIKVNGKHYTSTSLGDLPPESASGVKSSGAFNDQFVTYTVKEEYENSYQYHLELHEEDQTFTETGEAYKFLVITHGRFYRDNDEAAKPNYLSKPIRQGSAVPSDNGEVYDMILTPSTTYADHDTPHDGIIDDNNLWYVGPNLNIDKEMGIKWAETAGGTGEPLTEYETKKAYKDKTGFDPYNIQFKHASDGKYLSSHMTSANRINGILVADYTGEDYYHEAGSTMVTLEEAFNSYDTSVDKGSEGYDHTNLQISNQTFMAVSDANGNMQLMPRFDHNLRMNVDSNAPYFSTLEEPVNHPAASVDNWRSQGPQTSFLVRPQIFEYHIIDNEGNESLRYKTAGEYTPSIPEHFKSPLATDFKYYFDHAVQTTAASSRESYTAAATANYFKKEAESAAAMETAAKALTVADDYYFQIGASAPYTYKKVTVTKAHSGSTDATYTTSDCTESEWTNAIAHQETATDEATMQSAIINLADKGIYYYQIGTEYYAYKMVEREGGVNTITISNAASYTSSESSLTAIDEADFETKAKALSGDGDYYYKIGPLYDYQKVIITNGTGNILSEIAAKADISDKEITGTFAEAGLNAMTNQVYVRYSYDPSSDFEELLQGKWVTITLGNKDVQATGAIGAFQKTATDNADYATQKAALTTDGEYYFKIGTSTYTYKKVTVTSSSPNEGEDCTEEAWANALDGTGVLLYTGSKPGTIDGATTERRKWQWKFLASPVDPSSDYYGTLDPYAVRIYNRDKNYTTDMSLNPNPMGVGIKVNGTERFALLSSSGGYALAVTGLGTVENYDYTYQFLNGADMTAPDAGSPVAAITALEADFTIKTGTISAGAILDVNDDVTYNYTYNVITNDASGNKLAVNATQDKDGASEHSFVPYLPADIQTPLLDMSDYLYYGGANIVSDTYTVIPETHLITLYGLYDDVVYVRYAAYDMDNTTYEVPNKKDLVGGKVARHDESKDAALNINNGLPYNIIWENDNMMRSNDNTETDVTGDYIKGKAGQDLKADGANGYVWKFQGNDPYALKIYNNKQGKYIHAASAANDAACTLTDEPTEFMLLKRDGYDYGVLEMTSHKGSKLTMTNDDGTTLGVAKITTGNPKYFIIFGLSTHKLIYHLVLANIGETVEIPYSDANDPCDSRYTPGSGKLVIDGTTQRNLSETYQLGSTIMGQTYSVDAGEVSIGDVLVVPTEFERPNTIYFFYVDNIQSGGDNATYQKTANDATDYATEKESIGLTGYYYFKIGTGDYTYKRVRVTQESPREYEEVDCTDDDWSNVWQDNTTLNALYKGLEITKLMSEPGLIGGLVKINIGYAFQTGLETNAGEGFVTSTNQNLWYTYEAKHDDGTPYLAHYTNAWGLQAMAGRDTRYTNDYLWSPVGDVYGFKMYNRYMIKNSNGAENVMTMPTISEGTNLKMAIPGSDGIPEGNEVFELLGSNTLGYFRIHPVINNTGTQYYIWKDPADDYAKISTNYSEWTFNLPLELLKPYVERKGYVGGLTEDAYKDNKAVLDRLMNGTATYADTRDIQGIVYDDDNILHYTPGYYRLHNQPGVSSISPVRYASGYLHKTELTGDGTNTEGPIPIHFYSKQGVSTTFGTEGLKSGYTYSDATRGDIPVPATEYDPSTIFYFPGNTILEGNPRSTMQTQGLYVAANANGDADNGTTTNRLQRAVMTDNSTNAITFSLMDIGGAVLLIHDGAAPATRRYLNFDQTNTFQKTATDDADMNAQALKFISKGTYYFKIGGSTYKKLTVTSGYVASPETNATYSTAVASNETDWNRAADIYDLKYYHESPANDAKWCMVPANNMGLMVSTNNGGDDYYYTTFYAPFDVKLPANVEEDEDKGITAKDYSAYICESWNNKALTPIKVPLNGSHAAGKFVPAGTPVIIRTSDTGGNIKLSFPSTSPTSPAISCIFSGEYLEQLLALDPSHDVYTLGLPFTSEVEKDPEDYNTTGDISAPMIEQARSGIGFYINANSYKEADPAQSMWLRNNRYVLHNKIYYRETSGGAREYNEGRIEFVPVLFDGEELPDPNFQEQVTRTYPIGVFDLQGRKVATEEEVQDGTWRQQLSPGIYIVNGKKVAVK